MTIRNDAGESIYFARELESILPEAKDVLYREMTSKTYIPVNSRHGAGTKTITYRGATKYGRAKIISAYGATDIPKVGRSMFEASVKVHSVGSGAAWTRQEVRESQPTGKGLDRELALQIGEENARTIDQAAWLGDAAHGINGFLNYPGLTAATIPADGTGASKTWASKTGALILRDAANMIKAVTVTTNGVEKPNMLLLPLSVFIDIGSRAFDTANASNKTILAYLKDNLAPLGIQDIVGLPELETAGAGGTTRAFIYTRDSRKVEQHIPLVLEATPPQPDGLSWSTYVESRFAGTVFYYLLSAAYGDGV
jgi:hypothetical protein